MHACHTRVTLHSFLTKSASWLPREEGGTGLRVELELQLVWGRVRAKKSDGDSGATMPSRQSDIQCAEAKRAAASSLPQAENHKLIELVTLQSHKIKPLAIPPRFLF